MSLLDWKVLRLDTNFLEPANFDQSCLHGHFHSFHHRGHGDEARHAENDAEHCQERAKLMCPNLLEPERNGAEQIHRNQVAKTGARSRPASFGSTFSEILPS